MKPASFISVIIPALNEAASVGKTVRDIRAVGLPGQVEVIVANNGSTDDTAAIAAAAGARVVAEPVPGYGAACLAGIAAMNPATSILLFLDADGSDVPGDAVRIVEPILSGRADLVIGSRALGTIAPGAMTLPQRFGNWLATRLIRWLWGAQFTDLGPFRAIRRDAYDALQMADRDYGWTVEMQARAAKQGLRCLEVPTDYRRRIGKSKISGTVKGVIKAGTKILYVIAREYMQPRLRSSPAGPGECAALSAVCRQPGSGPASSGRGPAGSSGTGSRRECSPHRPAT